MCTDQKVRRCQTANEGNEYCCNMSTVSGTCDNCGTRCPDATANTEFSCCAGCFVPPIITTTLKPQINFENICFPSTAQVNLEKGKAVAMSELQIGDRVQTGTNISNVSLHFFQTSIEGDETKFKPNSEMVFDNIF